MSYSFYFLYKYFHLISHLTIPSASARGHVNDEVEIEEYHYQYNECYVDSGVFSRLGRFHINHPYKYLSVCLLPKSALYSMEW